MIKIKPGIDHKSTCPLCGNDLKPHGLLWQGIHVCAVSECAQCHAEIIDDLPVGQARYTPCQVDKKANKLYCASSDTLAWFGLPFADSLKYPQRNVPMRMNIEKFSDRKKIVILNCIDYLYGHSLLKLLNADAHLKKNPELGVVLIIPSWLRWMAPPGLAEIWVVDLPLSQGRNYYPELDKQIQNECRRFDEIYISRAHSHPLFFDISFFTRVQKHDFKDLKFRITFIWREDRLWLRGPSSLYSNLKKAHLLTIFTKMQRRKVTRLFNKLKIHFPHAVFTVAGMGKTAAFPRWIDDHRVKIFDEETERKMCGIYAESRLVIGVHGSNMLLPSAHAGLTIDLMPEDRWPNFSQDILYQEQDPRMSSYRYRYLPLQITSDLLSRVAVLQVQSYAMYREMMVNELEETTIRHGSKHTV